MPSVSPRPIKLEILSRGMSSMIRTMVSTADCCEGSLQFNPETISRERSIVMLSIAKMDSRYSKLQQMAPKAITDGYRNAIE